LRHNESLKDKEGWKTHIHKNVPRRGNNPLPCPE